MVILFLYCISWGTLAFVLYLFEKMDFPDIHKFSDVSLLGSGKLLIAQPFMSDGVFSRTVVYLCEYGEDGALGFVLNNPTDIHLGDVLPELYSSDMILSQGGPVQLDTLHIIHRLPGSFGGAEVNKGVYWGGSLEALQEFINGKPVDTDALRLFVGYSGWSPGQLENELKEGSWLIGEASSHIIFDTAPEDTWRQAIFSLGKEYRFLAGMPVDPNLN